MQGSSDNMQLEGLPNSSIQPAINRTVFIMSSPEKPTFDGTNMHPMIFLEELEFYIKKMNGTENAIIFILDCLTGEAKTWSRILYQTWNNIKDFKRDFVCYYWGDYAQRDAYIEFRNRLWVTDEQNKSKGAYFCELYNEARFLMSYFKTEENAVETIMKSYPRQVRLQWMIYPEKNVKTALRFFKIEDSVLNDASLRETESNERSQEIAVVTVVPPKRKSLTRKLRAKQKNKKIPAQSGEL